MPTVEGVLGGATGDSETEAFWTEFLRDPATTFTAAVCTGSVVLGAAGRLRGRRATTHWRSVDKLADFGAVHEEARVVIDGKYVTAAGVSAGIDVALSLAAMLTSDTIAQPPDYRVRPSASVPCAKARDGTGRGRCPRT